MGTPLLTGDVFQWARFCNGDTDRIETINYLTEAFHCPKDLAIPCFVAITYTEILNTYQPSGTGNENFWNGKFWSAQTDFLIDR